MLIITGVYLLRALIFLNKAVEGPFFPLLKHYFIYFYSRTKNACDTKTIILTHEQHTGFYTSSKQRLYI